MGDGFIGSVRRTARRRLKRACGACGLPVVPGDRYEKCAEASDGRLYSYNLHEQCETELQRLWSPYDDPWPMGALDGSYYGHDECSPEWVAWFNERKQQEGWE